MENLRHHAASNSISSASAESGGTIHVGNIFTSNWEEDPCLRDLRVTDPHDDKQRIEDVKGGLHENSYRWVLDHPGFLEWRDNRGNKLLWITGGPGKGKTMIMCGIINHLAVALNRNMESMAYFFCEATNARLNNATGVIRSIIYQIVVQHRLLLSHVERKYRNVGRKLFEDSNAWYALADILMGILEDQKMPSICILIDALDECEIEQSDKTGFEQLNSLIGRIIKSNAPVKLVVSSRNRPPSEEAFGFTAIHTLDLDQSQNFVSTAVDSFINHKVDFLRDSKGYPDETANFVREHLISNANNTFLWVALVCKRLERVQRWDVKQELKAFPAGLNTLYRRMFNHVASSDQELYRDILALMTAVYRPITLEELRSLLGGLYEIETSDLPEIIQHCGFFLTLQESTVSFVHYSAKEFLLASENDQLFPLGLDKQHRNIVSRCLEAMSSDLKRNIYDLGSLDAAVGKFNTPSPDPLTAVLYSSIYWIDHLQESHHSIEGDAEVCSFIYTHFLHWLEALALQQNFEVVFEGIRKLLALCGDNDHGLGTFAKDALRFVSKFGDLIQRFPLQAYASSLIFAPTSSDVRQRFWSQRECHGANLDGIDSNWGPSLLDLDVDPELVIAVAFSANGQILVSASCSNHWAIQLWDVRTGRKLRSPINVDVKRLDRGVDSPWAIALSPDNSMVALASETGATTVYRVETGKTLRCFPTNNGRNPFYLESRIQVVFSSDSKIVASLSSNGTASFWHWKTGAFRGIYQSIIGISPQGDKLVQQETEKIVLLRSDGEHEQPSSLDAAGLTLIDKIKDTRRPTPSVVFAHGNDVIMIADSTKITVCDTRTGTRQNRPMPESAGLEPYPRLAVSPDTMVIAFMPSIRGSGSRAPHTIQLWSSTSHTLQRTLRGNDTSDLIPTPIATSLAFSPDGTMLASSWGGGIVQLWDLTTDLADPVAEEVDMPLETLTLSPDGKTLARTSSHRTQVLDMITNEHWETTEAYWDTETADGSVRETVFSPNGDLLACVQASMIQLWRATTGRLLSTSPEDKTVSFRSLSLHNEIMAITAKLSTPDTRTPEIRPSLQVQLWHMTSGSLIRIIEFDERDEPTSAFSPTGNMLVVASATGLQLLSTADGAVLHTSWGTGGRCNVMSFSPDEKTMAAACPNCAVMLWDIGKGTRRLIGHRQPISALSFSPSGRTLASTSSDNIIHLWDVAAGVLRYRLDSGPTESLAFDPRSDLRLFTDCGVLDLHPATLTVVTTHRSEGSLTTAPFCGFGLSPDNVWLMRGGERILWLPHDYRPRLKAVRETRCWIRSGSDRVIWLNGN